MVIMGIAKSAAIVAALLALLFSLARPVNAQGGQRPMLPENVKKLSDIEYARVDGHSLRLDLYLLENPKGKLPVVVWVHGGGWGKGSKDNTPALFLTRHGYAVASISYRLSGVANFPAQIQDCKAATRWLRANADKHGLDADHIGAWGASAGGHLVAMLGTTGESKDFDNAHGNREFTSRVQAVVDFFGPTDFLQMDKHAPADSRITHDAPDSPESLLIGAPIQENREKVQKANPITYIHKNAPPFLIVHGDKDNLVPVHQSKLLHEALNQAGVPNTLWIIEGAGHGFGVEHRDELESRIRKFFDQHLKQTRQQEMVQ
ncbi:MAG: alpha/beta hydrolase fold domain-containing protein [Armatimonadaceae bacterium]